MSDSDRYQQAYQQYQGTQQHGSCSLGSIAQLNQWNQGNSRADFVRQMAASQAAREHRVYSGNKPLVVCGGTVTECKDLDEAQRVAEREAHAKSTDAYILKPVKLVAPKRETVTTELP